MSLSPKPWKILDRRKFLIAAMNHLAGDAHISFEGDLRALDLEAISGASTVETSVLKRNTLRPEQDFVVLPLNATVMPAIARAIGGTLPRTILHIQIECCGDLEMGIYDNFQHPGFGASFDPEFFNGLQSEGVVRARLSQTD